jgi:hypothetical protein
LFQQEIPVEVWVVVGQDRKSWHDDC